MKRFLGPALTIMMLAGCGGTADETVPASATDCGTFELKQGERLPATAATCLVDAVTARRAAHLKVTAPTTEGDPIPITYTAGPDGRVEVVTDSRQDRFGSGDITRESCTGPIAVPDLHFTSCR